MKHEFAVENETLGILRRARSYIEQGWCQGRLEDDDGNVCPYGALKRASHFVKKHRPYELLQEAVFETAGTSVVSFNDSKSTTKRDVLAAFDRAIVMAEAEAEAL